MKKQTIRYMVRINGRKLPLIAQSAYQYLFDIASLRKKYGCNMNVVAGSVKVS